MTENEFRHFTLLINLPSRSPIQNQKLRSYLEQIRVLLRNPEETKRLIEELETQRLEIQELKKDNRVLRSKITRMEKKINDS